MFRSRLLFVVLILLGLSACQRQAAGGFLPTRNPAVRVAPPVNPPIRRAVYELGASLHSDDVQLPTLEQQLALAEQSRASRSASLRPHTGPTDSVVSAPTTAPPPTEKMTSLADQLGVYGRGTPLQSSGSADETASSGSARHQPSAVEKALAKAPEKRGQKIDKAQRWKNTGSDLRPALLVLVGAVILMLVGLKL